MKSHNPLISVVILAGPKRDKDCIRCISSVLKSTFHDYEILLVDNTGQKNFSSKISRMFPSVRILHMPYNTGILGFNIGYANAHGKYILSLDDDAAVRKDTLSTIAAYFKMHKQKIGVVGVNSVNPSTGQHFHKLFGEQDITKIFSATVGGYIVTREVLDLAGYYDDSFFMWIHEDDFFLRVRDAGYEVQFSSDIVIFHYDSWHTTRYNMVYYMFRNSMWMFMKNFAWYLIPILTARLLITWILFPIKRKSILSGVVGLTGILMSIVQCSIPIRKRKPISNTVQWMYLKYYVFGQFPQ